MDDMIVKYKNVLVHINDLKECFENLGKNNMNLNLDKCAFDLGAGTFLGFMFSNRGIKVNPEKNT